MKNFSRILVLVLCYFLVYALHANFFNWFNIDGVQPNLFVVLVLIIGMFSNKKVGAIAGFIIGLYTDFLYSNCIGISSLLFAVIGYNGSVLKNRFSAESKITIIIVESIVTVLYEIILVAYRALALGAYIDVLSGIYILFVEIVFNALLVIILYPLITKLGTYLENSYSNNDMPTRYF